ncbi:MAG TPA: hypothetical protein VIM16_12645 [Mucilaginibacter sp.]|jgi:hypothetical protein
MKSKQLLLIFASLITAFAINSCKKSGQSPIQTLFTGGRWQLASVLVFHFTGNQLISTDTLNTTCDSVQNFIFYPNNTCTYTNFDCIPQSTPAAKWSLTADQLHLQASVVCKDTTAAGSSMPFSYASIVNLGQYSLVLLTGDIQPNYSLTKPRKQIQYGFVREKVNGVD